MTPDDSLPGHPLTGVRVVVMASLGPAPFAAMLLADQGADVVRVERPTAPAGRVVEQTSDLSPDHDVVLRGSRSVIVDITTPDGVESVLRLCDDADVLIEGYRPGVMERRGLGPDVIIGRVPDLVYARLTGYGQTGPLSGTAGHDLNYVAHSGVLDALTPTGEAPRAPLNILGDYAGGGAIAAFGILAAVLSARSTGVGQVVDAAMVDGLAVLTAKLQGVRAVGDDRRLGDDWLSGSAPYYRTYACADGRHLAVAAVEQDFYESFVRGLGADLGSWPDRHDRSAWPALGDAIAAAVAARPLSAWLSVFAGIDACVSGVLTFDEAAAEPHNRARGLYRDIGGVLHPAPAPRISDG